MMEPNKGNKTLYIISMGGLSVQLLMVALLTYLFWKGGVPLPFVWASLTYALLARLLRLALSGHHRKGVKLALQHRYDLALPCFEASVGFFERYRWVDRWRAFTLFSAMGNSYREMGLCQLAASHVKLGDTATAKTLYEKVLEEFPDNGWALIGLQKLEDNTKTPDEKE